MWGSHSWLPPPFQAATPSPFNAIAQSIRFPYPKAMEVHFSPEVQAKIEQLARETGRPPDKLLEDAMAGYAPELAETREILDSRYDDLKSGRAKPVPGEAFFENLRQREDDLLIKESPNKESPNKK
jgi:hypothetical protein